MDSRTRNFGMYFEHVNHNHIVIIFTIFFPKLKLTKPQNKLVKFATHPWMLKELIPRAETVNDKIARYEFN